MSFGPEYARSYDAFYRSKDYAAEARFVRERLATVVNDEALCILDIGCGTGLHDAILAEAGHTITGADMSDGMLARAIQRRDALPGPLRKKLNFVQGDARTLRTGHTYDAVISLFHVMSYMAGDGDFEAALRTARAHLKPGGAFLFDFWYGPAVLADPPQARERMVDENGVQIRRMTTPYWEKARDAVRIIFDVEEVVDGPARKSTEEHVMRYFFEDGLRQALQQAGFETLEVREWLTAARPHEKSFGVYALGRAI
jgi:SAM-dependent methyltransferase